MVYLSNQQQFLWSVLLLTIEMTSKCSKTTSCRRVVSLQSFEHFDVISMVNKSTDHVVVRLFFYHNIDSFDVYFNCNFLENAHPKKRKTNCATITSFPWSVLLSNMALNQFNQRGRNDSVIVKTLIEYRNDVKIFKTRVEPLAAGEWFHYKVLNMVFKNCTGEKNGNILTLHLCHH